MIPPDFRRRVMSDRRRFLKGLTSIPLATVLANPRLAAAVSVGLQDVEAKLGDGGTISTGYSDPRLPSEFASEKANLPHFD
jgi:hypothetical protein